MGAEQPGSAEQFKRYIKEHSGVRKWQMGEYSTVGEFTRLFVEVMHPSLAPFHEEILVEREISLRGVQRFMEITGSFLEMMKAGYKALSDIKSEKPLRDMVKILEAEGSDWEVLKVIQRLSNAYMFCCYERHGDYMAACQQAGLFARYIRDEIESGRNWFYYVGIKDVYSGIEKEDLKEWFKYLQVVKLFAKADLAARLGMKLKEGNDFFFGKEPKSSPVLTWVLASLLTRREARIERLKFAVLGN